MALDVRCDHTAQVPPAGARRARDHPISEAGLIGDLHTVASVADSLVCRYDVVASPDRRPG